MALQKLVNGRRVDLTPTEEAQVVADKQARRFELLRERKLRAVERRVDAALLKRYLRLHDTELGAAVTNLRGRIANAQTIAAIDAIDETSVPE